MTFRPPYLLWEFAASGMEKAETTESDFSSFAETQFGKNGPFLIMCYFFMNLKVALLRVQALRK